MRLACPLRQTTIDLNEHGVSACARPPGAPQRRSRYWVTTTGHRRWASMATQVRAARDDDMPRRAWPTIHCRSSSCSSRCQVVAGGGLSRGQNSGRTDSGVPWLTNAACCDPGSRPLTVSDGELRIGEGEGRVAARVHARPDALVNCTVLFCG